MHTPPSSNQERRECALRFFACLATRGAGYELRGVRGWAHADDVQQRLRGYRWSELLGALAEGHQLDRERASPPDAKSPSYVYRIAERGLKAARVLVSAELPSIPALGPPDAALRVYVRPGGRWALDVLRDAYRAGGKRHRMNGEPGWLTGVELRKPLEAWNRLHGLEEGFRIVHDTDTLSLIASRLIERAHVQLAWGRDKPVVMYRVTLVGLSAELLEWYEPGAGRRRSRRNDVSESEDPERARIRRMLLQRGVLSIHVTEQLIDFWIGQDERDREEARRLGLRPPCHNLMGSGN